MRPRGPLSGVDGAELMVVGSAAQDVGEESQLRERDALTCNVKLAGVLARCSLSHLYDVISRMGDSKKELVKEIGFGGLLYFPGIKQIDRKFAVWLMCRVDALAQTLLVGDGIMEIKFNKDDIARIFGIPCRGRKVGEHGKPGRGIVSKIMTEYLNMNLKEFRSIKAVQEVVDREYEVEMTKHEKNSFKVAFVMYVMSTMLVPGARFDYVSVDYWDGLENADDICLYDWSDFVMRRLLDAVVKMKTNINSRKKIPNITGCTLFLQVLYLDSIDLGVWTMEHSSFPRIRCFGPDRLKFMIRADTVKQTLDPKDRIFGKSKLLPVMRVCYSWAADSEGIVIGENCSSNKLALWRATILFARLIGLPAEVSASLFQVFVGFDDNMASSMVSNLISVVEPYSSGIKNRCVGDQYRMNGGPGDNVVCDAEDVNTRGEEYGSCLDDCKGKRKCYADSSSTDSDDAICFNVKKVRSLP